MPVFRPSCPEVRESSARRRGPRCGTPRRRRRGHQPASARILVSIPPRSVHSPPGRRVHRQRPSRRGFSRRVLQLSPGSHRAEATLAGYQKASTAFDVTAATGAPAEVRLILEAPPALVSLSTDLSDGTLSVDGGGLQGKFGFHVPGKDQLGVSDFRFSAN